MKDRFAIPFRPGSSAERLKPTPGTEAPKITTVRTPPRKRMVVAIWFDGVLAFYQGNRGSTEIGRPLDGAKEMTRWIVEELDADIIILTGRRRVDLVEMWLKANNIRYTSINRSIDDSSIRDRSLQVIADLYIGQHCLSTRMGDFASWVEPLQQRYNELALSKREKYDWGG